MRADEYLHDEYGKKMDFHDIFMFNFWMQERLTSLKAQRISLSPVFKVGRVHVRLDKKVLTQFARQCCVDQKHVADMIRLAEDTVGCTNHPDGLLPPRPVLEKAKAAQPVAQPERDCPVVDDVYVRVQLRSLKETKVRADPEAEKRRRVVAVAFKLSCTPQPKAARPEPVVRLSLTVAPDVSLTIKKRRVTRNNPDPDRLKVQINVLDNTDAPVRVKLALVSPLKTQASEDAAVEHKAAVERWKAAVAKIKAGDEYRQHMERYRARIAAEAAAVGAMIDVRKAKKTSWDFDRSIVTDGVAVSLQFSKKVTIPLDGSGAQQNNKKKKKKKKNTEEGNVGGKKAATAAAVMAEEYDKGLSTLIRDGDGRVVAVVLGLDPGRVNLATIAFAMNDRDVREFPNAQRNMSWNLSRGEFYEASGVRKLDAEQRKWHSGLHERFSGLKAEGGALRTADPKDIVGYLNSYATFRDEWWSVLLRRRESRVSLQRYSGKRSMLDGFFSRIKRAVTAMFPGVKDVIVGYGQAVQTMKSSGRGEMAVPTTGAFKSCQRVFKRENVPITDEFRSTAVAWETGKRKEAVYRIVEPSPSSEEGTMKCALRSGHTPEKKMPLVPDANRLGAQMYAAELKAKRVQRRKPSGFVGVAVAEKEDEDVAEEGQEEALLRYSEMRGLRFCPERRLYLDRDREAARTIARLCATALIGLPRPAVFHRSFKLNEANQIVQAIA